MAAVDQVGPVEDTSAALNVVDVSRRPLCDADRLRAVNRTRRELRVVEGVEEVSAQLDELALGDVEVLEHREVEVANAGQLQRVAPRVGVRAETHVVVLIMWAARAIADSGRA